MFVHIGKKLWYYQGKKLKITKADRKVIISNEGEKEESLILLRPIRFQKNYYNIRFTGSLLDGSGVQIRVYNRHKQCLAQSDLNAFTALRKPSVYARFIILAIRIKPFTSFEFGGLETYFTDELEEVFFENLSADTLIVTPSYPSDWNRYFGGFVHSRVKEYEKAGLSFDLACIHEYTSVSLYSFESICVLKGNFDLLDSILHRRWYQKILVHFFDEKYAKVLDRFDLSATQIYLWVHGPETLYSDWNYFVTPYFQTVQPISSEQKRYFDRKDEIIERYNAMDNVHWIFVSNWIHAHSEKLVGLSFRNYSVIPNIIDEKTFDYIPKDPGQRKKIFMIRRLDNINKYGVDINVRAITALSKRKCFEDMDFYIYGEGDAYDMLIEPIRDFKNVHFIKEFLTHEDIARAHKKYGIALFATRYDAQGVSMCEAAMSGLVVVGSALDVIKEFIPEECETLNPVEEYQAYADVIERLYYHPEEFRKSSETMASAMRKRCSYEETIAKEIALITKEIAIPKKPAPIPDEAPLLTVIIPAYNASKYLRGTIHSLTSHMSANRMEILIVNDGSKDDTEAVAREIIEKMTYDGKTIIRLINKENGGHGSALNVGIREARGKYLKIVDSDDTLISQNLEKLIQQLERETADVVLSDYYDDVVTQPDYTVHLLYATLVPGLLYDMEDLCMPGYGYGFSTYGPLLATGTFRTSVLQEAGFRISEKLFYVDMEFDAYVMKACQTVRYLPLFIYKYRQGAAEQSISEASYRRNYLQHEKVLMNLIGFWKSWDISEGKKNYLFDKLICPMVKSQYYILMSLLQSPKEFRAFDQKMKEYPELYRLKLLRHLDLCRRSGGLYLLLKRLYKTVLMIS